jgi:hypothetical protein
MKSFIKLSAFFSLLIIYIYSFSQTPWYLSGNSITSNDFLGSTNPFPLKFRTNNIERIHINANPSFNAGYLGNPGLFAFSTANYPGYLPMNANGYVGIRTGSPRAMLHIRGPEGIFGSGTGWRPWMQNGVFMNERINYLNL